MSIIEATVTRRVLSSPLLEALTWPHGVNRLLESVNPVWSLDEVRGTVTKVRHQTNDTITLTIETNGNWLGHQAGQYVNVGVKIDGRRHTRCYSIASSAHQVPLSEFELTIKAKADGYVSKHLVDHAHAGMKLNLSQAEGDFTLGQSTADRLVLISAGSGITPVMSMLRTVCDKSYSRPRPTSVVFIHYSMGYDDSLYRKELDELAHNPNVKVLRSHVSDGDSDLDGVFSGEHLDTADPEWRDAQLYVCGPTTLMDAVAKLVSEAGYKNNLHVEQFTSTFAPVDPNTPGATGSLSLTTSDTQLLNDGGTILDQAEAAGISPAHGCRMGICHTCVRPKESGCVRDLITGAVSGPEAQDIRICISVPVGDVAVDL